MRKHRLQGHTHTPFDPPCTIWAKGKSALQHRRRHGDTLETEIQVLSIRGEVVPDDVDENFKVLALTELADVPVHSNINSVGVAERTVRRLKDSTRHLE